MYLSKLELHGFKSFAAKTVLQFDPGVTAIVGPNGCGKSNIVDAVRWVIGEQRARVLRSEKMENVIFNGTTKRRPLGLAEVQLTIQNTRGVLPIEYTEVTLGRRLYRSGESEYLLNGTPCRLKDITDLFMDTGMGAGAYSVIELKMVEELLSEHAEERRQLFEEAAGVSKYKRRRAQTLRKLESTQTDLGRVQDLVDEIQTQVRRLKRQAERAVAYQEVEERLRTLELAVSGAEMIRLAEQRGRLDTERQEIEARLASDTVMQRALEADLAAYQTSLVAAEQQATGGRQAYEATLEQLRQADADLRVTQERIQAARRELERLARDESAAVELEGTLKSRMSEIDGGLLTLAPEVDAAASARDAARTHRDTVQEAQVAARAAFEAARSRFEAIERDRQDAHRALDRAAGRIELLEKERHRLSEASSTLAARLRELQDQLQPLEQEGTELQQIAQASRAAYEKAQEDTIHRRKVLEETQERLQAEAQQREALRAELDVLNALLSSFEDVGESLQTLARDTHWSDQGELVTVADVLVCDEAVRPALDAALGAYGASVVVTSPVERARAIAQLKQQDSGRATFVALDQLRAPADMPAVDTSLEPLAAVIQTTEAMYKPLAELLLVGCYRASSLDEARTVAASMPSWTRIFSPQGEWVDGRGLEYSGSDKPRVSAAGSRIGRRQQRDRAAESFQQASARCEQLKTDVATARAALEGLQVDQLRMSAREAERKENEQRRALDRARYEVQTQDGRLSEILKRLAEIDVEYADLESVRALEADKAEQARAKAADAQVSLRETEGTLTTQEDALRKASQRFNEAELALVQKGYQRDQLIQEKGGTTERLDEIDRARTRRVAERAAMEQSVEEAAGYLSQREAERSNLTEQAAAQEEVVKADADALLALRATVSDQERKLREAGRTREGATKEEHQRALRLAEIDTRLADLISHVQEAYGIDLQEEFPEVPEGLDEKQAREEIRTLRAKIRAMGPVNLLAREEYEEQSERLTYLQGQLKDLLEAEQTLRDTIDEINETASNRFQETFAIIQQHFSQLFRDLFGEEAEATVFLERPDEPLESPIEVKARPRGKRPSVLAQLSGGEKTLTATALLFAIYLVKPSPFCILDEVDAPLDDANVGRFMQLIRNFSDTTQFILVTHNKLTMEAADRMYGVTMEEQGVSKLVGVTFDEAAAEAV